MPGGEPSRVSVLWDVKGHSFSMCCSKRVSASPGRAGLKSAAHWPEAACLHRTKGGAMTSDSGLTRRDDGSLSRALVTPSLHQVYESKI